MREGDIINIGTLKLGYSPTLQAEGSIHPRDAVGIVEKVLFSDIAAGCHILECL